MLSNHLYYTISSLSKHLAHSSTILCKHSLSASHSAVQDTGDRLPLFYCVNTLQQASEDLIAIVRASLLCFEHHLICSLLSHTQLQYIQIFVLIHTARCFIAVHPISKCFLFYNKPSCALSIPSGCTPNTYSGCLSLTIPCILRTVYVSQYSERS